MKKLLVIRPWKSKQRLKEIATFRFDRQTHVRQRVEAIQD